MSANRLEVTWLRMLYDPAFAEAVARDAAGALAGAGLEAWEVEALGRVHPAATRVDGGRQDRLLDALERVFSATMVATASSIDVRRFFASDALRAAFEPEGDVAAAMGAWWDGEIPASAAARPLYALEAAARRVSGARGEPGEGQRLRPAPWVERVRVPAGALDGLRALHALARDGRLARIAARAPWTPPVYGPMQTVAVCGTAEGASFEVLTDELVALFTGWTGPRPEAQVVDGLVRRGWSAASAASALAELVADGLLTRSR